MMTRNISGREGKLGSTDLRLKTSDQTSNENSNKKKLGPGYLSYNYE